MLLFLPKNLLLSCHAFQAGLQFRPALLLICCYKSMGTQSGGGDSTSAGCWRGCSCSRASPEDNSSQIPLLTCSWSQTWIHLQICSMVPDVLQLSTWPSGTWWVLCQTGRYLAFPGLLYFPSSLIRVSVVWESQLFENASQSFLSCVP